MKKVALIILTLFIITGCNKQKSLTEISYDELSSKIQAKDSFVLYVGRKSCSHCQDFKPVLEKVVNKYNLEVFYIDLDTVSTAKYQAVMKKIEGEGTPTTVYIEKGKTKSSPRLEGARDYETTVEFFKDLNMIGE